MPAQATELMLTSLGISPDILAEDEQTQSVDSQKTD